VVEDTAAVLRYVKIGKPVVVVVAHRGSHPEASRTDASFFGDIGEGPIAIVSVEAIPQRLFRCVEVALAAIDQVDIKPAVLVVVEEGAARTGGFGQILLGRASAIVDPLNPAERRRNLLENRKPKNSLSQGAPGEREKASASGQSANKPAP